MERAANKLYFHLRLLIDRPLHSNSIPHLFGNHHSILQSYPAGCLLSRLGSVCQPTPLDWILLIFYPRSRKNHDKIWGLAATFSSECITAVIRINGIRTTIRSVQRSRTMSPFELASFIRFIYSNSSFENCSTWYPCSHGMISAPRFNYKIAITKVIPCTSIR